MRLLRALFYVPILILISPVLVILGLVILVADTGSAPLRSLFAGEIRRYGLGRGFGRFMQRIFVPTYKHHVQSFVLGAAGILVVTVGLRGLGILPVYIVYIALALEFTLLVLWAITVFFTEEEEITENGGKKAPQQPLTADQTEELALSIRELGKQIELLESRLRTTEMRFQELAGVDASLRQIADRMNVMSADQLNLAVRREFEQLVADISRRVQEAGTRRE
jgi:hypothetical protein